MTTFAELKAQYEAARDKTRQPGATQADREAVIAAWNACNAYEGPDKPRQQPKAGYASRAGKRQAAERRAREGRR